LSYFQELFASENIMSSPTNIIYRIIPTQMTQANNDIFTRETSFIEIKNDVDVSLAPGLDDAFFRVIGNSW
jgi:hypothetical protein